MKRLAKMILIAIAVIIVIFIILYFVRNAIYQSLYKQYIGSRVSNQATREEFFRHMEPLGYKGTITSVIGDINILMRTKVSPGTIKFEW